MAACLDLGKDVLIEKPLALTRERKTSTAAYNPAVSWPA